jgi:predicted nucleotidyltransferase component of viral defense system
MKIEIRNLPESIRVRLNNYARENHRTFQSVFYLYAFECFLRRLSYSKYGEKFILKGGVAFLGWGIPLRRVTKDIDFQGYTENSIENIVEIMKEICCQPVDPDDGMVFNADSLTGTPIMETAAYQGIRVSFTGSLGVAVIYMLIDVSFANVITPSVLSVEFPPILGAHTFKLHCYPCETTIAEKFHAITDSGVYNDRYKDFYDLWMITKEFEIQGEILKASIVATFTARKSEIPQTPPIALTKEFAAEKQQAWRGFIRKNVSGDTSTLENFHDVIMKINEFLQPVLSSIAENHEYSHRWLPDQGWSPTI